MDKFLTVLNTCSAIEIRDMYKNVYEVTIEDGKVTAYQRKES